MSTRFKVLFLASWYPNEDYPMWGIFIKRHAQAVSRFCDVAVLHVHQSQHRTNTKVEYSVEEGIKTVRVYAKKPPFENHLLRILHIPIPFYEIFFNNYIINCYKGLKIIKTEFGKFDIIHLNVALPMGWIAFILNLWFKIPVVITEHFTIVSKKKEKIISEYHNGWIITFFLRILFKKAKKIMPVSNEFKHRLMEQGFLGNYQVIPNAVDTNLFKPSNSCNLNNINYLKRILHVSLLGEENRKNVSDILRACKILSRKRQDFLLNVVGGGHDKLMLEELAEELNIKNRFVFFLGRLSDEELTRIMNSSDFFVLNSYKETFSVVCAEALSSGIPVISTRCGGPEEYINEEVGILIEPDNIEELVKVMDYMLDNHWKYDPQKLHKYVERKFGYEVVGKQFYDVYKEIMKE
jgi:glycosyltransferase involved in cell wall biosynthesis